MDYLASTARVQNRPTERLYHCTRLAFLLLATVFAGVFLWYSIAILGNTLVYSDESDYLTLTRHLLFGGQYSMDGQTPSVERAPGYVFYLLPFGWEGSLQLIRFSQCLLLLGSVWALAGLSRCDRVWHPLVACGLLVGVCLYPVLIYCAGKLFPQTLVLAMLTLVLVLLIRGSNGLGTAALIGLAGGWIVLISPTALVIIPLAVAYAWRSDGWSRSRVVLMIITALVLPLCWTLRNLISVGEPIMMAGNLAAHLDMAVVRAEPDLASDSRTTLDTLTHALERLAQLAAEPGIYLRSLLDFFAFSNSLTTVEERTPVRDLIMLLSYYSLLALVVLRLCQAMRGHRLNNAEWLILLLYLGTALLHAAVFTRIRYRLPFDFLLLLPALHAIAILLASRISVWPGPSLRRFVEHILPG